MDASIRAMIRGRATRENAAPFWAQRFDAALALYFAFDLLSHPRALFPMLRVLF